MKYSLFSAKITNKDGNYEYFILARKGKALVRGIFIGTCFNKKEILK